MRLSIKHQLRQLAIFCLIEILALFLCGVAALSFIAVSAGIAGHAYELSHPIPAGEKDLGGGLFVMSAVALSLILWIPVAGYIHFKLFRDYVIRNAVSRPFIAFWLGVGALLFAFVASGLIK